MGERKTDRNTAFASDVKTLLEDIYQNTLLTAREVLTVEDVARLAGYSVSYVRNLMARREIPYYKRKGRRPYFKKSEVNKWLTQDYHPTAHDIEAKDFLQNYVNS